MVDLALVKWRRRYQSAHANIRNLLVTGGGSGTEIAALINKTVDLANASRQIKGRGR